ncbi:hypothetical protein Emag_002274 [Eimeria magna]
MVFGGSSARLSVLLLHLLLLLLLLLQPFLFESLISFVAAEYTAAAAGCCSRGAICPGGSESQEFEMADGECALEGSLQELIQTPSLKWIFVGGKGGVGKTTTSCAIAVKLAEHRESVLLLSTDPAHNLSDALTQKFSSTPSLVNGFTNLYAMEIDARQHEAADFRLAENSDAKAFAQLLPELLQAVPGIDEALSFAELMQGLGRRSFTGQAAATAARDPMFCTNPAAAAAAAAAAAGAAAVAAAIAAAAAAGATAAIAAAAGAAAAIAASTPPAM